MSYGQCKLDRSARWLPPPGGSRSSRPATVNPLMLLRGARSWIRLPATCTRAATAASEAGASFAPYCRADPAAATPTDPRQGADPRQHCQADRVPQTLQPGQRIPPGFTEGRDQHIDLAFETAYPLVASGSHQNSKPRRFTGLGEPRRPFYERTRITTQRFCARPSDVSFRAIGRSSPKLSTFILCSGTLYLSYR